MPPVYPLEIRPFVKGGRYTHMAKRDAAVWERFLDKFAGAYQGVAYDVALGGTVLPEGGATDDERRGWQYSTALKIDAVIVGADHALITEVRPWATLSPLGAALGYTLVARREQLLDVPMAPAIICEGAHVDVKWIAQQLGITIFEV